MSLEQIGIISQIVGTLVVIASLIFIAVQIRQNTEATRVQVQENMTANYISVAEGLIANAEVFARGLKASRESFAEFSDADKLVYFGLIFSIFKHFENIHSQHRRGFIDTESWNAWSEHILMHFNQPGVKMWWELRQGSFNPHFREFLASAPPSQVRTFVEIMESGA